MNNRISAPLALLALVAALPAHAATPINESRPLSADGSVSIENVKGRIVVRTWAQPQVKVSGSLGKGAEPLIVEGDSRNLSIEVKYPNHRGKGWLGWGRGDDGTEPTILEVTIPQRASLEIDSVSADVDVQQMAGRKLDIESVSGDVVVTASSPGEASFQNVSGDTTLRITSKSVRVGSVSGDVKLRGGLDGEVHLESVSGNAEMNAGTLGRLEVSTVSGDAKLQLGLAPSGTIKAESVSGDLDFTLPKATGARLSIETFSGDIASPVGKIEREDYGPGKSLDATLGNGDGQMHIESFSGDVNIVLQ